MARKSYIFAHLYRHYRDHKGYMNHYLVRHQQTQNALPPLAAELGALECLYWQALGCDELLLAKKIARTIKAVPANLLREVRCSVNVSK